ncbi:hypothetical protein LP7551_00182 [Roseibium album]|nr:hypothetical protein LP7551_00182 [Roseibium album]
MRQITRFNKSVPNSAFQKNTSDSIASDRGILLDATELFAGRDGHDIEDKKIFLELARNLLPATALKDRRRIASLLASHPEMPDDLLERLATDEDELTAFSALRYSPRLSVDLLLEIAKTGPDTLRKAIANRPSLRESVINSLCEHAGAGVIQILLDRNDIILSSSHQTKLSRRSEIVATLGLELAGQDALSPDGLMSQFLHLPVSLKAKAVASAEMTSLVKQAQAPAKAENPRLNTSRLKLIDGLMKKALTQNRSGLADLLGQGLGLSQTTCDLLLQKDQGDGLVVALKSLNMTANQVSVVVIRMFGDHLALADVRALLRFHRTLSVGAAKVLVGQWMLQDQTLDATGPHQGTQYQDSKRAERQAKSTIKEEGSKGIRKSRL